MFETILARAVRLCGAAHGAVFRYDGSLIHFVTGYNTPSLALETVGRQYPMAPGPTTMTGRAILERRSLHVPDVRAEPAYENSPAAVAGFRSTLTVPMLREGQPIGAVAINRWDPLPFSDEEISVVTTLADQAVIAIENVRLFNELREKNQGLTDAHAQVTEALDQQTATSEVLRVISQSPTDVQPVLDAVVESAVRLCGAYDARIWTLEGDRLIRAAGTGPLLERSSDWLPLDPALPSPRAFIERRVVHFDDMAAIVAAYPRLDTGVRQLGVRSGLATPLMREGQPIGVLAVRRQEPERLSDKQVELLRTFADQAVIAIENVRLFK